MGQPSENWIKEQIRKDRAKLQEPGEPGDIIAVRVSRNRVAYYVWDEYKNGWRYLKTEYY